MPPLEYARYNYSVSLAYDRAFFIGGKGISFNSLAYKKEKKIHVLKENSSISYDKEVD